MLHQLALTIVLLFCLLLIVTVLIHLFFLVPYVPSKMRVVEAMVRLAKLRPRETVYDLGCGDGRLLIAAEKKAPVKTIGFEIAPLMLCAAWIRKTLAGSRMELRFKSFFSADLKKADVIFCYLIPDVMPRLAKQMKRSCRRGTRIISNTFHIPGLTPTKIIKKNPRRGMPTIYVYVV